MENRLRVLGQRDASDPPATLEGATEKLGELKNALRPRVREGVLVAFSGGMDSAFLLWIAAGLHDEEEGGRVVALTTSSPSTPTRDKGDAARFAESLGVEHVWRESREMELGAYVQSDFLLK